MLNILILNAVLLLVISASFLADRARTLRAARRGLRMLWKMLPDFSIVLVLLSLSLGFLNPGQLKAWLSVADPAHFVAAALAGSVSLVPGFVVFPLSGVLVKNGASVTVVSVFITTMLMVGVVTFPLEAKYFGRRAALVRNALSLAGAVIIALLMGAIL